VASEVDVCNRALGKLGAATIISLSDDDPKAVTLSVAFPLVRDAELRRRRWKFSLSRKKLPAEATAPLFGYARQFVIPGETLRVIQVGEWDLGPSLDDFRVAPNEYFSIEGRRILTNLTAPLAVRTIDRVEDVGLWDAAFIEAFASRLAFETCYRITQSDSRQKNCKEDYRDAVREGRRADAFERAPNEPTDDTWVMARRIG
jgi:hypothetical protein